MVQLYNPTLIEDPNDPGTYLIQNMAYYDGGSSNGGYPIGSGAGFLATKLSWGDAGERFFEVGVDRGVFFTEDGTGVAWNGLISVKGNPTGGDPTPYYLDGVKYLNDPGRKEFGGSIEAYTYPDEFAEYDGWYVFDNGLFLDEQESKPFCISYRTSIGNDVDGVNHGYKIHIVYDLLATPTSSSYLTIGDAPQPSTFSWTYTTTPQKVVSATNKARVSHVVIDSTKTDPSLLRYIEENLYGSSRYSSQLLTLDVIIGLFEDPVKALTIDHDPTTGMSSLEEFNMVSGDLWGRVTEGLYTASDTSRLIETSTPGLYTLESS
jgi:hypothetical protein